jgi:predicted permease
MLAFGAGLSVFVGVLSGTLPAWRWSRASTADALRRGGDADRRRHHALAALIVAELALAFVMVDGAGLFAKSFRSVSNVDVGFEAQGLWTARLRLPQAYRDSPDAIRTFYEQLTRQLGSLRGVDAVGAASQMPFTTGVSSASFRFASDAGPREANEHIVFATPGYFEAMGLDVTSGRGHDWTDGPSATSVAVITRTFADAHFPGEDPVGRSLEIGWDDEPWQHTIVGVVEDVRYRLTVAPFPTVYVPFSQRPTWYQSLVIRGRSDGSALAADLRNAVWALEPTIPVEVSELEQVVTGSRAMRTRRFSSVMVGSLAGLAMLLACIGIYGALAAAVGQRRREFGIRMALGATSGGVGRRVLRDGLSLAGLGLGGGFVLALILGRLVASQLYGVEPTDASLLAFAAFVLTTAVVAASILPARRATGVSPVEALRD